MLRVIQELLEDVDALALEVGVEGSSDLVERLFSLPLMLVSQNLVLLTI